MPHDKDSGAQPAGPCALVIFGAAGDLTKRLVVPALYNLTCAQLLPEEFTLIGFDLADHSNEDWRNSLTEMVEQFANSDGSKYAFNRDAWNFLASRMSYMKGDLTKPESYGQLKSKLEEADKTQHTGGNYLFYLAVADRFFGTVVEQLGKSCLSCEKPGHWRRIVIEKPFGHDLQSAQALDHEILDIVSERQIYRIDHFLGKETVQNLMMFRFANGLFEPLWNRDRIDHVQITVAETVGVEKRGRFYESTGALRDMIPNHGFQLLAMTAMEAPNSFDANDVRAEKAKVVEAVRVCDGGAKCNVVRGQYSAGKIGDEQVPGYRQEPDVAPNSPVETYVAFKFLVDNWRWSGVPFYLRTGKRLARKKTQIAIKFKGVPCALMREEVSSGPAPNWLLIRIQPDEGIALEFGAKVPGPRMKLGDVRMDFKYQDYFGTAPATGYETLLYDVMMGDPTLFQRADNIEAGWAVVQPVLDMWAKNGPGDLQFYAAGSQGPAAADELLARDGRAWRPIN
ncbi:MAG: glucose-6-phosphate dehydrogenase [Acidobacteriaceae bacterium]|nr:glucose-6-phosphate dehydrogenase [Acidobacteriaceae bacterium]MBV9305433.1 glucose-6-phosphate dehydrogenase [Acidobacteriaceae bacterium]